MALPCPLAPGSCGDGKGRGMSDAERRIARAIFEMRRDQGDGITNLPKYLHILEDQPKEN